MDRCRCYLCEKLCYCDSSGYNQCEYRKNKSFGVLENRMYEESCTRLAVKFASKHDWRFEGWIGHFDPKKHTWCEGAGSLAMISDEVCSLEDMRTDIMMDAPIDAFVQYLDDCLKEYCDAERENRPMRNVNYRSWLMGARHNNENSSPEWKEKQKHELDNIQQKKEESMRILMEQMQRDADDLLAESDGLF